MANVQSEDIRKLVVDARNEDRYQIVTRPLMGSDKSWFITTTLTADWVWQINEYRILRGVEEPPMTDEMDEYSVYYYGYEYYFLEDGILKKQINVNITSEGTINGNTICANEIQTNYLRGKETNKIVIDADLKGNWNGNINGNINGAINGIIFRLVD